jgi:hypothetical protein
MANSSFNEGKQTGNRGSVKDEAQDSMNQVKDEARRETKKIANQAEDEARSMVHSRKEEAAHELENIADAFRQTGNNLREKDNAQLARYTDSMAEQVENIADYLHNNDINGFLSDAESFARRQPELFLGGAFTLGLLAARFFKSSSSSQGYDYRGSYGSPARRRMDWRGYGSPSEWETEQQWQGRRAGMDRYQREQYGSSQYGSGQYGSGQYGGGQYDTQRTGAQTTGATSATTPGYGTTTGQTATAGRDAGVTAGTTAATTTSGGQTESRMSFDKDDKDKDKNRDKERKSEDR